MRNPVSVFADPRMGTDGGIPDAPGRAGTAWLFPGARTAEQASENARALGVEIPAGFWQELKEEKLAPSNAETPTA